MQRKIALPVVVLIALAAFGAGAGTGILAWLAFWSGDGQASQAVNEVAPQLSLGGSDDATSAATTESNSIAPQLSLGGADSTPEVTPTESSALLVFAKVPAAFQQDPTATPSPTPEPTPEPMPVTLTRGLYRINPEESVVTFTLQEDLRGSRIDVIGTTNEVGGDIIVDFSDPTASQVGQIVVNARTIETDNNFRNQAIRSQVLKSAQDAYEFITFTPTSISGLDGVTVMTNTPIEAQITGDLTIVDTTLSVTFDAVLVVADDLSLSGTASLLTKWADFGLFIPNAPGVSNITEEVTLAIDFKADLVDSEGGTGTLDYSQGLFRINAEKSTVTFTLQEDLRGQRIDVIGTTSDVGGDIIVNVSDPTASQIGQIVVNARTLVTDNNFRNQAIRSEILLSAQDAYEFITFTPTAISGLDGATVAVGQPVTFQITGDLTIVDTTLSVTFDATATLTTASELTGTATLVAKWADFGLVIPSVPGVSNITEDVTLAINFVADLVESQ
jgi:polyisoprenoid-binding protein YceI